MSDAARPVPGDEERGGSLPCSAVVRFVVGSFLALVVLTVGTVLIAGRIAQHEALGRARTESSGIATRLVAPLVDQAVRQRRPGATSQLDRVMATRMADGSLRHVKIWDAGGHVIWSDEENLVGRRFDLPEDVTALFGTTKVTAELSHLTRAENEAERSEGQLLEVYAGAFDADGEPLVFEAYLPTDELDQESRAIVWAFVPLLLGALVLFLLAVLPLAVSLARRVAAAQLERARMGRHALLASELERRRIAEDLHDGVIQDLASVGYAVSLVERELGPGGDPDRAGATLRRTAAIVQGAIASLRSAMSDIYPPDLAADGLVAAVDELVRTTAADAGFAARVDVEPGFDVSPDAGRLVYRVVREGLRNVVKHAEASAVEVRLRRDGERIEVWVVDDGRGVGVGVGVGEGAVEGHLGLRLLGDTLEDFGGTLELRAREVRGTVLVASFPSSPLQNPPSGRRRRTSRPQRPR